MLDEPYKCIAYARKNNLGNVKGWRWTKKYEPFCNHYTRKVRAFRTTRSFGQKYQFGVEVPRSVKHALELDKQNGNDLWKRP